MVILALLATLAGGAVWAHTADIEVRINARKLEDGRVEFALQQRVGGEWGERQHRERRFLPADTEDGRWLNSTPVTVGAVPAGTIHTVAERGVTEDGVHWRVWYPETGERWAWIATRAESVLVEMPSESYYADYGTVFAFGCMNNGESLVSLFEDLPFPDLPDQYTFTVWWDSSLAQTLEVDRFSLGEADSRLIEKEGAGQFYRAFVDAEPWRDGVANHDALRVRIEGFGQTITASFDVPAMRGAPTWPNILACGSN